MGGLISGEAYIPGKGGGGHVSKRVTASLIEIRFYIKLISLNKVTFSPVQYCHPAEGGLNRGGGGGGGLGGGASNRSFIVVTFN